ncbi:MAG TPA: class I SAM-dependent methyltransferase [Miltoncostaeaceae bacterium]|nr:class I SAM-dependent methyltransferase [Miltoncostaeaceae bacterium]
MAELDGLWVDEEYARAFTLEHAHYEEDLALWRQLARSLGSPVLDLGAATGRVAIALARDGAEVIALDGSEPMVAELHRALAAEPAAVAGRVHPVVADLRDFAQEPPVPLAIMAMNTLQALVGPADQLACLRAARAALRDDGELWFDVAFPDLAEIQGSIGVVRLGEVHHDGASGAVLQHAAWYDDFDPVTQTLEFTLQVDRSDDAGTVRRVLRHHRVHLFMPAELGHLLARAGLRVLDRYGDFGGGPVTGESERQVYRCGRMGA